MDLHGGGKKEKRGIDWWRVMQPHHSIPEIIAHAANNSSKDNVVWKSITRILTPWEMRNTRPNRFRLALETIFREIRIDAFFLYLQKLRDSRSVFRLFCVILRVESSGEPVNQNIARAMYKY